MLCLLSYWFQADDIKEQADNTHPGQVKICSAPCDIVADSDIIFCCVSDAAAVKDVSVPLACTMLTQCQPRAARFSAISMCRRQTDKTLNAHAN